MASAQRLTECVASKTSAGIEREKGTDVAEFQPTGAIVVGPRELPTDGRAWVWIDSGSGPGHKISVRHEDLTLSELDDGQGQAAIYNLRTYRCRR
ncbi:hypothetical protein ABGB16_08970 [Micromonospora sp. B11E3]|uniref:hypothetical protein n=1 Tax=Micromonospora sp. B11E3 TaxID=3153562 RepID=UPI00325EF27C